MATNRYVQPDNHREELTGTVCVSETAKATPLLVGQHGTARIVLLGDNLLTQPTLIGLQGKHLQVTGIWKRGALHFWSDNCDQLDELPVVEAITEEPTAEEDVPADAVLEMISNMEKVRYTEKKCQKCQAISRHFAKFCWNCGVAFPK